MSKLLIKGGSIITWEQPNRVLYGHGIAVEGSIIRTIAPVSDFDTKTFDEVIDAAGKTVIPGLINAHMHCYSSFATGLTKAEPATNFLEVLKNLWWRLDKKLTLEDCYYSALIACIQSIKHGTTTIIDHHASPNAVRGSLQAIARAVRETGIRASLCYEVSDRDGPEIAEAGLLENQSFAREVRDEGNPRLHALFGLHASFTLGSRTLSRAVEMAKELKTGVHIHVAEDALDRKLCIEEHGRPIINRLHNAEALGPRTICAHCVHIDQAEMALLRETNTIVTHQPQSNMNNAVGVMDLRALTKNGVLTGLGTDAMTSDMLEELRSALWIYKLTQKDPSSGFSEVIQTLFPANGIIAGRLWPEGGGMLREGSSADIAIFDYDPPTPLTAENAGGHLVFGLSQASVDTTIAAGGVLMRNKELVGLDEERIAARAREQARALWSRF